MKEKTGNSPNSGRRACMQICTHVSSLTVASFSEFYKKGEDYRAGDECGFDSEALIIIYTAASS